MEKNDDYAVAALTKDRILEAEKMVELFKQQFEERFGIKAFVSYQISGKYRMTDISLNDLLFEVNTYLFEMNPSKTLKLNYRTIDISEGILFKSRAQELVELRHIFSHIAYKIGYSYSAIGRFLSQDHCTILHAVKAVNNMFDINEKHYIGLYNIIELRLLQKYGTSN